MNSLLTDKEYIKTIFAQISGVSLDSVVIEPYAILQPWQQGAETLGIIDGDFSSDLAIRLTAGLLRAFDKLDLNCCYVPLFLRSRYSLDKLLPEGKLIDCFRFVDYFDTFPYGSYSLRVVGGSEPISPEVVATSLPSGSFKDCFASDNDVISLPLLDTDDTVHGRYISSMCGGVSCNDLHFVRDILFNAVWAPPSESGVDPFPVGYENFFYGWRLSLR